MQTPEISSPILAFLRKVHERVAPFSDGQVATYIPELALANPDWFGICIVTATGSVYEVGDTQQPFTIQSISKPLVYGIALEDNGRAEVLRKIGVEPSGEAFNSISLEPGTGRPMNPMINAGAIASSGLIAGRNNQVRFERIVETLSLYAGRTLGVNAAVARSESETGHRNRAIGHMLRNVGILEEDPTPILELYFKQCAIEVTCRDLAVMAATLANRGINPLTGKQAVRGEYVESILSVMGSCGMYDYAGEWIHRVGMPAKSGVAGGIIAVLPGQLGIGVFSPRLDPRGNSSRAIRVCDELSRHLDLHLFNHPRAAKSVIRSTFDAARFNSCRMRTPEETAVLVERGDAIKVYQLQGNLAFGTIEAVVEETMRVIDRVRWLVFDMKWVLSMNECSAILLHDLVLTLADAGKSILFSNAGQLPLLRRIMRLKLRERTDELFHLFPDNDTALEWAENRLLNEVLPDRCEDVGVGPGEYELFNGLSRDEIGTLVAMLERRSHSRGAAIVKAGDAADSLYLLARGRVSAVIRLADGEQKRLATFSAGMAFGEMAVVERSVRSATILADSDGECDVLRIDDFDRLSTTHPAIKIRLLANLCQALSRKLRKANCERAVFDE